uniref:Uncharacterized membrane protein DDB_G0293934-like n=1 Tax=Dermatophagoides pteronyssinus TaxID=6956 RepID=A0A6P6XTB7_DERPT|nr:uncharacterized membrane protein DDB_G0293934-like [Dermatophagoides pteronyssinus]
MSSTMTTVPVNSSNTTSSSSSSSSSNNIRHHSSSSGGEQQQQQIVPFTNLTNNHQQNLIEIKSKFDAEFRRFSIQRTEITNLEDFVKLIEHFHNLFTIPFCLFYTDPIHGDLLPINNDKNFALAIASAKPLLRLIVQRKGESIDYLNNYGKKKNFLGNILPSSVSSSSSAKNRLAISAPEDFRQVSSIIDVDIVPDTCRRVRLVKHGSDKPLGFYIRDGSSFRITEHGFEKVPGIFISRLVPGGLAESTGLLAVNDEVLEVNGIEVNGKSLDQVTDMMVANSSNLIITIRPANQRAHAAGHHNTLSSSYSSNTISNYPHHHHPNHPNQLHHHQHHPTGSTAASLGINQSMTIDTRHPQHHYLNHQYYNHPHYHGTNNSNVSHHYTNSLERSGHRSKVSQVDYYGNMYNGPSTSNTTNNNNRKPDQPHQFLSSASAAAAATTTTATTFRPHASTSSAYQLHAHSNYSHHPHQHHQRTHSTGMIQVIENDDDNVDDDDDDDDEDEVRDHFNAESTINSSTANNNNNNVTITTIATAITTSTPQIFTTNVYTLSSNPTMVECITIGPSTSTSKSLNNNNNNITNGINIGHQSPSPYVRKRNNSDVNNTTTTMSISNQQQQTPQHYYFNNNTNGTHQQQTANNNNNNLTSTTQSTNNDSDIVTL